MALPWDRAARGYLQESPLLGIISGQMAALTALIVTGDALVLFANNRLNGHTDYSGLSMSALAIYHQLRGLSLEPIRSFATTVSDQTFPAQICQEFEVQAHGDNAPRHSVPHQFRFRNGL